MWAAAQVSAPITEYRDKPVPNIETQVREKLQQAPPADASGARACRAVAVIRIALAAAPVVVVALQPRRRSLSTHIHPGQNVVFLLSGRAVRLSGIDCLGRLHANMCSKRGLEIDGGRRCAVPVAQVHQMLTKERLVEVPQAPASLSLRPHAWHRALCRKSECTACV